ncbi:sn-glycerol-3-phosphate ABC transporter ATP-binding protein UgpC [Clostridium sp. Marseille-Q2269]|uniref:ABC transporter ATP-binding protein n=1 Tax=Clostridium sp. Marseille-Q2269 TaxID=2942205 RepID=UPI0020740CF3|nr:sn-glycerol-3-phosphate ABC transporter ATP-binding protein UgpC [Clostridium sp. Marseille-Q2269]
MAKVILKNLGKTYENGFEAVKGIDLNITDGEFMVLVGPSGCAKSTTLRMIAGLEEISNGEIYIGDKCVNDVPPKNRGIAMVFQNYALYPHMTVYDNMAFSLKMNKVPKDVIKQKVDEASKILGLESVLKRRPKALSGGQRQRVAVGRAIVRDPEVFLFDEPLSNLDAKLRVHMRVEICKLHKRLKSTMIYVTHDQVEAMTMGDRICVMDKGQIMQVDTPLNIYNYPKNKFVAGFIGSPSMNFIEAELISKGDSIVLKFGSLELLLSKDKQDKVKDYIGRKVWFGFRPEDVRLKEGDKGQGLKGTIDVIEHMGSESFVYFNFEGKSLISKLGSEDGASIKSGHVQEFMVNMDKCHIFDFETEKNITL